MPFGCLLELAPCTCLIGRPQIAVLYSWRTNAAGENNMSPAISLGSFCSEGHSGTDATSCLMEAQRNEERTLRFMFASRFNVYFFAPWEDGWWCFIWSRDQIKHQVQLIPSRLCSPNALVKFQAWNGSHVHRVTEKNIWWFPAADEISDGYCQNVWINGFSRSPAWLRGYSRVPPEERVGATG